eukprot:COSAG05_NODE_52_length_23775_cov_49.471110_6_plen_51_part_00
MHLYFQSIFRIQNFQHSECVISEYMCIFSQFSEYEIIWHLISVTLPTLYV